MGHGDDLRPWLLAAALLLLPAATPDAASCASDRVAVATASAYAERCDGSAFYGVTVQGGVGRVDAQWERDADAGYTSLGVAAPARYLAWHEDAHGCWVDVGLAGHMSLGCPASPPAPPSLPDLLP